MKDGETLGKRVKQLRKAAGLTQAQLAEASTLSPGTIGDIEADRQGAGKKIDRLAAALHTTTEHLRNGDDAAVAVILESMLSPRESRLIERFRSMNDRAKERLEDFAVGLQGAIKDRQPRIKQTTQEIRGAKIRRSG